MKTTIQLLVCTLFLSGVNTFVNAQDQSIGAAVTKKVGMYVFPAEGQDSAQQDKDESDCYTWAVQQSGVDPINPTKVEVAQVETGPDGAAVRGAARGAAGGAAIGAIAGDAGKGAAIGAVAGAVRGRRASSVAHAQAQEGNNQAAAEQEATMMNNFKKAYAVCLEGKGYTVQ